MSAFTARINGDVKLVGSTISCEGSPLHGKRHGRWRRNPHVQSYAVATDQVGLQWVCQDLGIPAALPWHGVLGVDEACFVRPHDK
jgi:translation initiation factor eIF-2B subunit epsilon